MRRYDVVFTYNTLADNAGQAMNLAKQVVASDADYFVEVIDGENGETVFDGAIEDIVTCPGCAAVEGEPEWGTVGDGYDGYCPSCADEREEE